MANIIYRFVADGVADVIKGFGDVEAAAARARRSVKSTTTADAGSSRVTVAAARRRGAAAQAAAAHVDKGAVSELRATERTAAAKVRVEERHRRHVARIRDRYFAEEQRKEERAAKAQAMRQERVAAKRTREMARTSKEANRMVAGAAIGIGGALVAGGAMAGGAAARQALSNQEKAGALSRASRGAGETAVDPTVLRKEAEAVAKANPGVKVGDILEAQAAFVGKTGDLKSARAMGGTFATLSSATGGSVADMANVAAELREKFGITDDADMKQALATLTMQGKSGAFELKDAAGQYSKLGAAAKGFGMDSGVAGITKLGGLTQIARSATGSPEQAATALEATFRQLIKNSDKLKLAGADIYNRDGSKRDITDILIDSVAKVGGTDVRKKDAGLQDIFGEEGIRALRPLIATFNEETRKGGDGVKALREQLDAAIDVPGAWADVQQDAAAAQSESTAQLTGAWESLTAKVGDQVLPILASFVEQLSDNDTAIETFAGALEVAIDGLTALVDFLSTIPGIGKMFTRDTSPEKELQRAMKESERVDGMIEGRGGALALSPDDPLAQRKIALDSKIAGLEEKLAQGPSIVGGPLAQGEFERQMAAAGKSGAQKRDEAAGFMSLAQAFNPLAAVAGGAAILTGTTREQDSLQARQSAAQGAVAGSGENQVIMRAGSDLLAAAAALKTAAEAQKASNRGGLFGIGG